MKKTKADGLAASAIRVAFAQSRMSRCGSIGPDCEGVAR